MGALFAYTIKSGICMAVFYPFYKFLLSNETFHRSNRTALLGILLLSLVLPMFNFSFSTAVSPQSFEIPLEFLLQMQNDVMPSQPETAKLTVVHFLLLTYLLGVMFFTLRSIVAVIKICIIIKKGKKQRIENNITIVLHDGNIAPFSWFRYIVIGENDFVENSAAIIEHEKAHIYQSHSFDLLICEIYNIIQWFNPAAWLLKRELQNIHEYQADKTVLDKGIDTKQYKLLLVQKAVGEQLFAMANNFNKSKLKKRINMMSKQKSNPYSRLKYLCVLPLLALVVAAFANSQVKNEMNKISEVSINDFMHTADTVYNNANFAENANNVAGTIRIISDSDTINLEFDENSNISADKQRWSILDSETVDSTDEIITKRITLVSNDSSSVKHSVNTVFVKIKNKDDAELESSKIKSIRKITIYDTIYNGYKGNQEKYSSYLSTDYFEPNADSVYSVLSQRTIMLNGKLNFDSIKSNTYRYMFTNAYPNFNSDSVKYRLVKYQPNLKGKLLNFDAKTIIFSSLDTLAFDGKILIILDGKEILYSEMKTIRPEEISAVSVLKGETAKKMYGEKGNNGVIVIETTKNCDSKLNKTIVTEKKAFDLNHNLLVIVDNKETNVEDLKNIKHGEINSINILKNEAAIKIYGEKAHNGVMIIETKNKL